MKFKKEFIDAIVNNRIAHAGQWQVEVQSLLSNYVFITSLLKKEQALSSEMADRCRDLQGQLIHMLTQFVIEVDALEENTDASDCNNQALLLRHIRMMSELNGCIYTFLNTPNSAP